MGKPLPEWCPSVDFNAPWSERCGIEKILDELRSQEGRRHRCYLKVGHDGRHVCRCGREWKTT
jgi:hypothetical protein